jgi:RNA polymerase sigma-70 factor (ECF subfamily)
MDGWGKRLSAGDAVAFVELYDACADRLHHYLCLRLRSREDAGEVLQEAFLRLARCRRQFDGVADPVAYAFVVARNEAARWLSRISRERANRALHAELLFREACGDDLELRETAEAISAALGQLDEDLLEVIDLKIYAGLTFAEIAEVTGLPLGTVATRFRRAIAKLRVMWIKEHL